MKTFKKFFQKVLRICYFKWNFTSKTFSITIVIMLSETISYNIRQSIKRYLLFLYCSFVCCTYFSVPNLLLFSRYLFPFHSFYQFFQFNYLLKYFYVLCLIQFFDFISVTFIFSIGMSPRKNITNCFEKQFVFITLKQPM